MELQALELVSEQALEQGRVLLELVQLKSKQRVAYLLQVASRMHFERAGPPLLVFQQRVHLGPSKSAQSVVLVLWCEEEIPS
jgi:hypothetical protein